MELSALDDAEPETAGSGDDEVEDGPAEREAAGLAGEAADDLGASLDFFEGALEEIGRTQALAQPRGGLLDGPEETPYVLKANWPGPQPPQLRDGLVSRFVASEREFSLFPRGRPTEALLSGIGRAEFAFEHKFPPHSRIGWPRERIDFPWDPWGVAAELALYDALRQAEGWARRTLARGMKRRDH